MPRFTTLVSSDELTFKGGELIMLKSRVNSEWLRGKLLDGSEGIFPKNFVEIVVSCLSKEEEKD